MLRILPVLLVVSVLVAADYPQFRGPSGNGVVDQADPVTTWSAQQNIDWKTPLPGTGWSQPIVVGNRLFLTAAVSDKLSKPKDMQAGVKDMRSIPMGGAKLKGPDIDIEWKLLCLDVETGKMLWSQTVVSGKPKYPIHPSNTYATETPCADADCVYTYFGATGTLAAFSHAGKKIWQVELGAYPFSNGFGSGSSPVLHDGKLFIANYNEEKAFLVAIDARTGSEIWRQSRETPGSSWATPFIWKSSQRVEIVACGNKLVTSHDPNTGKELWRLGGIDTSFSPSPAVDGDLLLLGASSPFSASPLFGIKAGAAGDITLKKGEKSNEWVAWFRNGSGVGMASPSASGGYLYIPNQNGLICVDCKTGEEKYKERLPKSRNITACPVIVGNKLLIVDETGKATWVKTGPQFEVLDSAELSDTFWASPAMSGNRLFLRGVESLYCIKKP